MQQPQHRPRIASVACALPPFSLDQAGALEFMEHHYAGRLSPRALGIMRKVFRHPTVGRRCFAVDDPAELVDEDPDCRAQRFTRWAVRLSGQAAEQALAESEAKLSTIFLAKGY